MKRCVAILPLVLLSGIILGGCDAPQQAGVAPPANAPPPPPPPPPPSGETGDASNESPPAPAPVGQPPLPVETKVGVFAGGLDELGAPVNAAPAPAPVETPAENPNTEIVKAGKGVGAKGRSLDEYEGIVVTPVKAYFAARERAFFDIEFPQNYRAWEASGNEVPKDFDDLKARFLDPLGLTKKLPPLPQGHKYLWDREKQELQVERPRR